MDAKYGFTSIGIPKWEFYNIVVNKVVKAIDKLNSEPQKVS